MQVQTLDAPLVIQLPVHALGKAVADDPYPNMGALATSSASALAAVWGVYRQIKDLQDHTHWRLPRIGEAGRELVLQTLGWCQTGRRHGRVLQGTQHVVVGCEILES